MEWMNSLQDSKPQVAFDDVTITCRRPSGLIESVNWSQLEMVLLMTTDDGPEENNLLWVLEGGDTGCVIPGGAVGMDRLLARLQQLPGFCSEGIGLAATSTTNQQFLCWRKVASA